MASLPRCTSQEEGGGELAEARYVFCGVNAVVNGDGTVEIASRTHNTLKVSEDVEIYFKTRRKPGLSDGRNQSQQDSHLHGNAEISINPQLLPYCGSLSQ